MKMVVGLRENVMKWKKTRNVEHDIIILLTKTHIESSSLRVETHVSQMPKRRGEIK